MKKGRVVVPDGEKNIGRKVVAHLRKPLQFIASDMRAVNHLLSHGLHNTFLIVSINLGVGIHFGSKRGFSVMLITFPTVNLVGSVFFFLS